MKKSPPARPPAKKAPRRRYMFRLFMAGQGQNSVAARANLQAICLEHLKGRFTIEQIDVVKKFEVAHRENILVTPSLVLLEPRPKVMIVGNLSDTAKVLAALRLPEDGS